MRDITKAEAQRLLKVYSDLRCGNCAYWMTGKCPREVDHIVSMSEPGCSQFLLKGLSKAEIKRLEKILFLHDI
jgi:hypothetical protein